LFPVKQKYLPYVGNGIARTRTGASQGKKRYIMMNYGRLFLLSITVLVLFQALFGCAKELVRTDLQTLQQYPDQFRGKQVIVTATLQQVTADPDAYAGKKVEITGLVTHDRFWGPPDWNFLLTDEENRTIRCYERTYRYDAWIVPVMAIKRAALQGDEVTLVGKLENNLEIELDWFEYQGQQYDTNYLPATALPTFM